MNPINISIPVPYFRLFGLNGMAHPIDHQLRKILEAACTVRNNPVHRLAIATAGSIAAGFQKLFNYVTVDRFVFIDPNRAS